MRTNNRKVFYYLEENEFPHKAMHKETLSSCMTHASEQVPLEERIRVGAGELLGAETTETSDV